MAANQCRKTGFKHVILNAATKAETVKQCDSDRHGILRGWGFLPRNATLTGKSGQIVTPYGQCRGHVLTG